MRKYYTQPLASELIEAYNNTDYCFTANNQEYIIRLNDDNEAFTSFLNENQIKDWAFITAWNPYSVAMPESYNQEQQQALLTKLKDYRTWKGEGRGRDGCWTPEESYFVADINREDATALGQEFGQNAILAGQTDGKATLVKLFEGFKYSFSNGKLIVDGLKKRNTHYLDNLEINPTRLGKGKDLINSEGPILSLHKHNRLLYLSSRLKDGSGRVYYATNENLLQDYIAGKCVTQELLDKSPSTSFSIKHSSKSIYDQVSAIKKIDFKQQIQCGDSFFTDLLGMTPEDPTSLLF